MSDNELMRRLEIGLDQVLTKLKKSHFQRYAFLRERLLTKNVIEDREFQRTFAGLYRVHQRSTEWKLAYYSLMERAKRNPRPDFAATLNELYTSTGRLEPSFASKLVAIINPDGAVYDSVVSHNLGLKLPKQYHSNERRLREYVLLFDELTERMIRLTQHKGFGAMSEVLEKAFPGYSLTPIRRLDLLLWQLRG